MPDSPKKTEDKILRLRAAWKQFAPAKTFGGMTLAQFEAKTEPSLQSRAKIEELTLALEAEQLNRDKFDDASLPACALVVNGVKGDPEEGPNSDVWKAMGYVPDDERKSGLTRKKTSVAK
jgi:hypothetical protein